MNRQTLSGFLLVCSIAFGMAVLGSEASPNPNGSHEHETDDRGVLQAIAQAPAKTREWKNPYEDEPDAVLAGKKLFMQHCAECHGAHARGIGRPESSFALCATRNARRIGMVFAQRKCMGGNAFLVGIAGATSLADRELPEIAALNFPDTIGFGVGLRRTCRAKAYLNQHWIPGSPRRPALVQSWAGLPARDSLKAGAGHPLIRGVQGLVTHGGVDRS